MSDNELVSTDGSQSPQVPPRLPVESHEDDIADMPPKLDAKDPRNPFTFVSRQSPPALDLATELGKSGWDQWRMMFESHEMRTGLSGLWTAKPDPAIEDTSDEEIAKMKTEKRLAELLAAMSAETIKIYQSLGLAAEDARDPDKIIEKLADYVAGGINIRTYRQQLGLTSRREGESPEDFLMRIQQVAEKCKFQTMATAMEASQDRQLDQFLQGMSDQEIQQELIKKNDALTLSDGLATANMIWAARKDVTSMAGLSIRPTAAAATSRGSQGGGRRDRGGNPRGGDRSSKSSGEKCTNCNWYRHE